VAVRLAGAGEMPDEVGGRDELLRPGLQVAQLDLAVGELVTEDHGEVGAFLRGGLELAAELPVREVGPSREAVRPEVRRHAQPFGRRSGVGPDDDGEGMGLRRFGRARCVEGEQRPVETQAESDARRRPAAEELDKPVVAAPGG